MNMIEQIKADREAGTTGPWGQCHREIPSGMYSTQVFPIGDSENTIATIHWHSIPTGKGFRTDRDSLARRIARVPDMEAALIAADELADAAACIRHWHDAMADDSGMVVSAEHVRKLWAATTAFRAAIGAT